MFLSCVAALTDPGESRQFSRKPSGGAQQLKGPPFGQPGTSSMFGMHMSKPHPATELQFGAPSVARITNVLPWSFCTIGMAAERDALVGVPPVGSTLLRCRRICVVGPSVDEGGSPGRVGMISTPGEHVSLVEPG